MNQDPKHLYLNVERNRKSLETRLHEIKKIHRDGVFPTLHPQTNILDYFCETVFSEKEAGVFFVANTSLRDNVVDLTIRPRRTPIFDEEFPPEMTICIRGYLSPSHDPSPEIIVDRIIDVFDSPQRPFELEIVALPVLKPRQRTNNAITNKLYGNLPEISRKTRENLSNWQDYLDWKTALTEARLTGIRYIRVTMDNDLLVFEVLAENETEWERFRQQLKQNDVEAYPTRYSANPWRFKYNRDARINSQWMGNFQKWAAGKSDQSEIPADCPWDDPVINRCYFRLSSGDQQEYDNIAPEHRDEPREYIVSKFPREGFLATSIFGDLALIQRQRQALHSLEEESGYAPFLSSWLFDIEQANTPQLAPEIDHWLMENINESQQKAVQKMIGAPDIALIQGPPGTGKTTVIGEAIYQMTSLGQRVVLASQANLAVDNALEKLASVPEIRAIRLGKSHKFSEEGQQYAEDRVLGRFYASIATACQSRYLDSWQKSPAAAPLEEYLATLQELESQRISIDRQLTTVLEKQYNLRLKMESDQARLKELTEETGRYQALKAHLVDLAGFLKRGMPQTIDIPEQLLELIQSSLMPPLQDLKKFKIDLDKRRNGNGSAASQTQLINSYSAWIQIRQKIPAVETLLKQMGESEALPDKNDEESSTAELQRLKSQLEEVSVELEMGDDRRLQEWRQLRQQIHDAEQKAPLADEVFSEIFTMEEKGVPFYKRLVNPKLDLSKRRAFVALSLKALKSADEQVSRAAKAIVANVESIIENLDFAEMEALKIKERQTLLDDLEKTEGELKKALTDQAGRLHNFIEQLKSEELIPGSMAPGAVEAVKEHLQKTAVTADRKAESAGFSDVLDPRNPVFRDKWQSFIEDWVERLEDPLQLANDNEHYIDIYIENCNVVGITCNENPRLLAGKNQRCFDAAIIDEVSKATPPELLLPMMLAKKSILVGDHRQLPPLFKEREGSWEEVLQQDDRHISAATAKLLTPENFRKFRNMVTASLFKSYFEQAPQAIKTMLYVQYRMHPDIMDVINHFYEYRLKCGLSEPGRDCNHQLTIPSGEGMEFITPNHHAIWIDSSRDPGGREHYERQSGTSKVNVLEAICIVEMLRKMDEQYQALGYGGADRKAVGVISFYGRQVGEILDRLRRESFKALAVDVNTVDQFQGKEKPIILVSLVRNSRSGAAAGSAFVAQFERINVAFSRAQELLMIFGASRMFSDIQVELPQLDQPGSTTRKIYQEILDGLNRKAAVWDTATILNKADYRKLSGGSR